ncbi:type I restriction enzyme HsdR N-terminal domain-containing protein [Brevundimonas sp. A19_0]|uniref:type I restriction enzyme HsdR N-terminal domain-containing protein n=1 Tax=Brevundimonas sp. A19_0 TaxID=2821087 RepID=UPI001ADBCF42|nr:type I restriction enzyme HsdR N-terminal domain-containing protein [Brevundimonas sp. A19_0]MBO9501649.1 hypothetical protein [Brevundimonas sp. A19_0]
MAPSSPKPRAAPTLNLSDLLLHSKALEPLSAVDQQRLTELQALDIAGWNEADVRGEIIDPVVRLLGYRKGDVFSVDRERPVEFRDGHRRIDYAATVWSENFWLIEAKRPKPRSRGFLQADLDQALHYAIHPEINAALVVLTDGDLWEVYDRETSVARPILRFRRRDLAASFDDLRALLGPWQAWFLERRRIVRLVDRVFDHEVNLGRVEEFRDLIDRRVQKKRGRILDNFRASVSSTKEAAARRDYLASRDIAELVDIRLFQPLSFGDLEIIAQRLTALGGRGAFPVLHRLLDDLPRDANHLYWPHAVWVLITLEDAGIEPSWLPAWLGVGQSSVPLAPAIAKLIDLCLTYFAASPGHQAVLLWSAAACRQFKILAHVAPEIEEHARALHALNRYLGEELSFQQIVTSPEGQMLNEISRLTLRATASFVAGCRDGHNRFRVEQAREQVRRMWTRELQLLDRTPNYWALRRDRDLGDLSSVEAAAVTWDELAHNLLCVVAHSPRWREYVLSQHLETVERMAAHGYWSARKLLGWPTEGKADPAPEGWAAERFFFGDTTTAARLATAYRRV